MRLQILYPVCVSLRQTQKQQKIEKMYLMKHLLEKILEAFA